MDGLVIKYEWLSHDYLYLKKEYQNAYSNTLPMLFDSGKLVVTYNPPEGKSNYGVYTGTVDGRHFEFASLNLGLTDKENADELIKNFFINRPSI